MSAVPGDRAKIKHEKEKMLYSLKQHQAEAEQDCSLYSNHTDMRQLQVLYRGIEIH